MSDGESRPASASNSLMVDEIGIESGVYGEYRLRSSYRPIFASAGDLLSPVAVEGLISPHRAGNAVSWDEFFGAVTLEDRPFLERLCRALRLRNHQNIGVDGLELHFTWTPQIDCNLETELGEIRLLAEQLDEIGLDPGLLVCEMAEADGIDRSFLPRLADEMRGIGVRMAAAFGRGGATQDHFDPITPEIVKVDGVWFQKLCREAATVELFGLLVSRFHDRGAKVLIGGIDDAARLRVALRTGADLFQGDHLARAALVGTVFEETPLHVSDLLAAMPNVLRFVR